MAKRDVTGLRGAVAGFAGSRLESLPRGADEAAAERAADRAFCEATLARVSRTFALSILSLPEPLRGAVGVAYLLCRIVDSVEDARIADAKSREALFDMVDVLLRDDDAPAGPFEACFADEAIGIGDADRALCRGASAAFRVFRALPGQTREAIRTPALEMSRGMRLYARRADAAGELRLRDVADLERYCYFVAGTVGELLTAVFEEAVPLESDAVREAVRTRAVSFGLGLQMVNIVKDVAEDLERGACFLPGDVLARHGTSAERLLDSEAREASLAAVREVCAMARKHLDNAVEYTLAWPSKQGADVRAFCAVPLALAIATLGEVERGEDTLVRGREPKIGKTLVAELLASARRAADGDAALREVFSRAGRRDEQAPRHVLEADKRIPLLHAKRPPSPPARRPAMTLIRGGGGAGRKAEGEGDGQTHGEDRQERQRSGRVLVTGASGHLGQTLVRRLLAEGYAVRALVRGERGARTLAGLPVEIVCGDVRDAKTSRGVVRGVDEVFHAAAAVFEGDERTFYETNVLGTQGLLAACREASIRRVVVTGAIDAVRPPETGTDGWIDEATPLDPFGALTKHARTKALAEHEVLRAAADGLDVVVVAPTTLVGPLDPRPSAIGRALVDHANGRLLSYARGSLLLTATRDAAAAHIAAMRRGRAGQRYLVTTELVSLDDLFSFFAEASGKPRPLLAMPGALARLSLTKKLAQSRLFGNESLPGTPASKSALRKVDVSKATRELGFLATCVRTAVYEAYADFARRDLVPDGPASRGIFRTGG